MLNLQSSDEKKKKVFSRSIVEYHEVRIKKKLEKFENISGKAKGTWKDQKEF